jgi:hypothetical protein
MMQTAHVQLVDLLRRLVAAVAAAVAVAVGVVQQCQLQSPASALTAQLSACGHPAGSPALTAHARAAEEEKQGRHHCRRSPQNVLKLLVLVLVLVLLVLVLVLVLVLLLLRCRHTGGEAGTSARQCHQTFLGREEVAEIGDVRGEQEQEQFPLPGKQKSPTSRAPSDIAAAGWALSTPASG